ncbi:ATP cone domain-containing protein [Clostridium sp. ATCC 25772]|uniref:ATP cone domain-containing protein n=1 Tax=Clostridium sp. ATCC 25772 TaxID=1676991 RepID=UPI0007828AD8|nr:ATP cone domain-containing protein [Clostridium sp. ATCC 25772]
MNIIKKNGRIEELKKDKIKVSIENAAKDSATMLNNSDVELLVSDIMKTLKKLRRDGDTSSYEVSGVVLHILNKNKFDDILNSYAQNE